MRGKVLFLVMFVLICAAGCYLPLKEPEGYSTELRQPQFQDIQIPFKGGYEYLESMSFTYVSPASDSLRVAELKIIGDTRVDEMVRFYKSQMAIHDFELKKELQSEHVHKTVLTFKKVGENEECILEIWRDGTRIHVKINLRPV